MPKQPTLRPSDVAVAIWLAHNPGERYEKLAHSLFLGVGEVHRGVQRLERAGLLFLGKRLVNRQALLEFLIHGLRYAFPPIRGPETRGIPTAGAIFEFEGKSKKSSTLVWPSAEGKSRGESLQPLYEAAPQAALRDKGLYRTLALIDAMRVGQVRERDLAQKLLRDDLAEART